MSGPGALLESPFVRWPHQQKADGFNGVFVFQSNAVVWSVALFAVAAFTYGKLEAKILGGILVATAIWGWLPAIYLSLDEVPF